jgi:hypothetical protein
MLSLGLSLVGTTLKTQNRKTRSASQVVWAKAEISYRDIQFPEMNDQDGGRHRFGVLGHGDEKFEIADDSRYKKHSRTIDFH